MKKIVGFTCLALLCVWLAGCNSSSSSSNNPVVTNPSLLAPMLYSPADGSTDQNTSPRLTWTKVNDAAMYDLQVSTSSSFANIAFADSTIVDDSLLISRTAWNLSPSTNYYWRTRAKNSNGASSWTSPWHFKTIINAPVLKTPGDGIIGQPLTVTFIWDTVSGTLPTKYRLQVSTSSTFASTIVDDSTLSLCTKTISSLSNGTTYYWRVNTKNAAGTSSWSAIRNFTTTSGDILAEGFEGSLSRWDTEYMINMGDPTYPRMRITTDAAHNGTHSLISDSNSTALLYNLPEKLQDSIVCLQFYIMAKEKGHTNFTVQIGQDAGSSGGLSKKYGFGFSPTDSITTVFFDNYGGAHDIVVKAIVLNQWYKCNVEVNFTTQVINYLLDDQIVRTAPLPTIEMYGIDKLLVLRGFEPTEGDDGVKKYYVDDISLYTKKQ